jgi:hypothetical protein
MRPTEQMSTQRKKRDDQAKTLNTPAMLDEG